MSQGSTFNAKAFAPSELTKDRISIMTQEERGFVSTQLEEVLMIITDAIELLTEEEGDYVEASHFLQDLETTVETFKDKVCGDA